jgi:hypothetical protein
VDKIKTFLIGLFYENGEPSLTRFFLAIGFLFAWITLFVSMFFIIQNANTIINAVGNIIVTILGVKSIQATVKNAIGSIFDTNRGEPNNLKKNPEEGGK